MEKDITQEVKTGKYKHTGNSGGGHTGHDGRYSDVEVHVVGKEVKTVFAQPPPEKRSLADLP